MVFGRGIVLERTKQWPKAEADMKKALELSPEQPQVLNYLGYSWIDQGLHLQEGMKMLERATELRPTTAPSPTAWAGPITGSASSRSRWSGWSVPTEQKGDDATIIEHLGDAYWHVGRTREARFQWSGARHRARRADSGDQGQASAWPSAVERRSRRSTRSPPRASRAADAVRPASMPRSISG